jgi:hypothetical protein
LLELTVNLCGSEVQALQMNSRGMRQLMVLSLPKLQTAFRDLIFDVAYERDRYSRQRQAPIANPGQAVAPNLFWKTCSIGMSARREFHSQIDQFKPDSPDRTGEIMKSSAPTW